MNKETYNKLIEIMDKKKKKIIVADSQREKRFNNIVYKNFKNMYNKDSK